MPTFVVHFMGEPPGSFRGRVRHVSSGEEIVFGSAAELLAFLEGKSAAEGLGGESRAGAVGREQVPGNGMAGE